MSGSVRRLTIDNFDDIVRVWEDAGLSVRPEGRESREIFAREMALPNVAVFGLFEDNRMLAVGIANWDGRRGWINRVAVDPDNRGRALAGRIIEACEDYLRSQGALVIAALIEDINYPSITAFQKRGFECLGDIRYFAKYQYPGA